VLGRIESILQAMEQVLAASGADWTVLRPPYLTDKSATNLYRTATEANAPGGSLARADPAQAMLDVVHDPATIRRAVGVDPAK
jgi:uncharacterized protein YbjT (DUF2867 family)